LAWNIDHIANVRPGPVGLKNPIQSLWRCWQNWAERDGIKPFHLREDRRQIQLRDLELLRSTVAQPASTLKWPPQAEWRPSP